MSLLSVHTFLSDCHITDLFQRQRTQEPQVLLVPLQQHAHAAAGFKVPQGCKAPQKVPCTGTKASTTFISPCY